MMNAQEIEKALTLLTDEEKSIFLSVKHKNWICYQVSGLIGIFPTKRDAVDSFRKKYHHEGDVHIYMLRPGAYNCQFPLEGDPYIKSAECRIERIHRENRTKMQEIALKSLLPDWYFVKETPEYQQFHAELTDSK